MSADLPPLPDMAELVERSARLAEVPGLREYARRWVAWAPPARERIADEAALLARPSLRPASLAAVGRTGARAARAAGPGLAADVRKRGRDVLLDRAGALQHVQEVVKAGGPTYVKLAQFIATAQGLLPDEWVEAFGWSRDTVAPLPPGMAEEVFEAAFEIPIEAVLADFDPEPLGSASIGQVHAATLPDGTEVVVKIRRPGLREQFESDLRAMALAAAATERASASARMANLAGFVELFGQLVLEEIDFRFEAVNQIELALASEDAGHDFAKFPRPIPSLTTEDVLVMTRMPGVPYTDAVEAYPDAVDGERLLRLAITGVLEHTIVYGVFHGDLHAGNVLIDPEGDFSLIDFGIAGRIDHIQRAALVKFLVGFSRNDTLLQLKALQAFRAIPPDADLPAMAATFDETLARLDPALTNREANLTVDQLSTVLGVIIRTLAGNGFQLPKELVLFFKNLLYLNGFAATLAPDTNLFAEIEPVFTYFMGRYPAEMAQLLMDAQD